jgi:hypothetical protein
MIELHIKRSRWSACRVACTLLPALSLALWATPAARGAEPPPAETDRANSDEEGTEETGPLETRRGSVALASLEERSRLVVNLLLDAARSYRKIAVERSAAQQDLAESLERLDREAVRTRDLTRDRLELLAQEVDRARLRLTQLLEESDRRLEDMLRLVQERDQLARRIADLRARAPQTQEPLTGAWEVTWLPNGAAGTFYLEQQGTLVTGQYKLGALGTGSLQGTFVGGKLYLQRIDAQRGRDAELEGVLDADGKRIRGTWQNFEMVQGGTPRGQWVAKRAR